MSETIQVPKDYLIILRDALEEMRENLTAVINSIIEVTEASD